MELARLGRILRHRWWLVAGVGALGLAAALVFTSVGNENRAGVFQATAPVRFEPQEGETIADLADDIEQAAEVATIAAGEMIAEDPSAQILPDPATARLLFIALGDSAENALSKAQGLRQAFFDIDPTVGGNVAELLADVEAQAEEVAARIAELSPSLSPEEEDLQFQHDLLAEQIASLRGRVVDLTVAEVTATGEEQSAVVEEKATLLGLLEELRAQKAALPPRPEAALTVAEQLQMNTLQRRLELLTLEYERLFLRQLGVAGLGTAESPTLVDLTPPPADPMVNGAVGLVGSLILGLLGLVVVARGRKSIWLAEDLPINLIGQVPPRRGTATLGEPWYDRAEGHPRKQAIQALRSAVEAQLPVSGGSLAVTYHAIDDVDAHALAVDLATSMASAGSSVLLVDADFEGDAAIGEYRVGGTSLSTVLKLNPEAFGFDSELARLIDGAYLLRPGLAVVPAGPPPPSPADALAGRPFRAFVEKALQQFDFLVAAVGDIGTPSAQVAMQRLRRSLLVLAPGRSTVPEVESDLIEVMQRQVTVLGAVFLDSHEARGSQPRSGRPAGPARRRPEAPVQPVPPAESPLSRLSHYPSPGAAVSTDLTTDPLQDLADHLGSFDSQVDHGLGAELVAALRTAAPEDAYEAVAEYLVSRVEDMLSATAGEAGVSPELISEVVDHGFVTLRPVTGHPTIGQLLEDEIRRESDPGTATSIRDGMERILSARVGRAVTIDDWLAEHFFRRHLARTDGEPFVWQLTSEGGTVQLLVPARRLDPTRIEGLITGLTASLVDELERFRKAANVRGDLEQAAIFETRIAGLRRFQRALGTLVGYGEEGDPSRGQGAVWRPDWSNGYRVNLARFQELGLLPHPVLSQEEIAGLTFVG